MNGICRRSQKVSSRGNKKNRCCYKRECWSQQGARRCKEEIRKVVNELGNLQTKNNCLRQTIGEAKDANERIKQSLANAKEANDRLEWSLADAKEEHRKVSKKLSNLETEIFRLNSSIKEKDEVNDKLESSLAETNVAMSEITMKMDDLYKQRILLLLMSSNMRFSPWRTKGRHDLSRFIR